MSRVALTSIMASMFFLGLAAGIGVRDGLNEPSAKPTVSRPVKGPDMALASGGGSLKPRLFIPVLGLHTYVRKSNDLNLGPAWWPTTGRPGGGDTVAIAGHRITHTHPFYYLDRVRRGDRVFVSFRGKDYAYMVVRSYVRPATDMHIADAVGRERLLLTACTPRGSARFRIVIEARLIGVR